MRGLNEGGLALAQEFTSNYGINPSLDVPPPEVTVYSEDSLGLRSALPSHAPSLEVNHPNRTARGQPGRASRPSSAASLPLQSRR